MDNNIGAAFVGLSQGLEQGIQNSYNIEHQGIQDRLAIQKYAEDSQYKQQSMQMEKSKYDLQMEQMQTQLEALKKDKLKTTAFQAFDGYMTDGNPRWFNQALQENPDLSKLFGNVVRVEPLNPNSKEDVRLFGDAGGVNMKDPEVLKRYVKTVDSSGNVQLTDLFAEAKRAGVYKTWDDEKLNRLDKEAKIAETNAKTKYYSGRADGSSAGSTPFDIKTAEYEADLSLKIKNGTATPLEEARYNALQAKRGGAGLAIANVAATPDITVPPPSTGFNIDNLKGEVKRETLKHISTLELTPSGKNLNTNMQKMYSEGMGSSEGLTKKLTELARNKNVSTDFATKFSTEAKSFLPEELRNITQEDLNNQKFKQAYMTVSSVFLKLQSGLTVSDAERKDFMDSMGSLSKNIKVNMSGLRNKFATIVDNYSANRALNPELYDYKYSKNEVRMREILKSMDQFIKPTGKEEAPKELDPDKIKKANAIFFGGE